MNRTAAVETWREVCGSDTVMASMPPTGRMLEEFAKRIAEQAVAEAAAWLESGEWRNEIGFVVLECTPKAAAEQLRKRIMALRSNVKGEGPPERQRRVGNRQAQLAGGPSRPKC